MDNQYYILPKSKIFLIEDRDVVENKNTIRWDLEKTKFLIKTKKGIKNSGALTPFTPMEHKEILTYLNNPTNGFTENIRYKAN